MEVQYNTDSFPMHSMILLIQTNDTWWVFKYLPVLKYVGIIMIWDRNLMKKFEKRYAVRFPQSFINEFPRVSRNVIYEFMTEAL